MELGDGGGQQARADFQATKRHDTDLGDADAEQALFAVPFHLKPAPRASLNPASAAQRKRQLTEPIPDANPDPQDREWSGRRDSNPRHSAWEADSPRPKSCSVSGFQCGPLRLQRW